VPEDFEIDVIGPVERRVRELPAPAFLIAVR
jgi:hypothetical protein